MIQPRDLRKAADEWKYDKQRGDAWLSVCKFMETNGVNWSKSERDGEQSMLVTLAGLLDDAVKWRVQQLGKSECCLCCGESGRYRKTMIKIHQGMCTDVDCNAIALVGEALAGDKP